MRHVCTIVLLAVLLSPVAGWSEDGAEFRSIFDGKTLNGWKGDPARWRVEDGAIVGEIPPGETLNHNTWLIWDDGRLDDFELRFEFRLRGKPGANSGVQIRCQAKDVRHVSGYQADLDMGKTWLGRIYDEHGRALLVERGHRVLIGEDGKRVDEKFGTPSRYEVLFRENDWNEYRVRACGEQMRVEINGTLFSELVDRQKGEKDLAGQLAFQLHSGPETKIELRKIRVRWLAPDAFRVKFKTKPKAVDPQPVKKNAGVAPKGADGKPLNLGFEDGTLRDWTAGGTAFQGQPVDKDTIASRWAGQTSRKAGQYFIGGYEVVDDKPVGELVSVPFKVTHPYGSFLLGGGATKATRVDVVLAGEAGKVIHTSVGKNAEEMRRIAVDLRPYAGKQIQVRVVDASSGGWGHLNFDDFRFHTVRPAPLQSLATSRLTDSPLLGHLVKNPKTATGPAAKTVAQMYLPEGFTAEVIAAEPQVYQPMAFTFDARGRIWVVEGLSYPKKRPEGEGLDRIVIFADEDGDGSFESRKVFAEGLNLVSGMEIGHGGVWVGAAPELLFIPDRDQDDRPDGPPQVLLDGFGYQDTHETLNSFTWGPDGWLYGNQGVFNYARIGKPGSSDEQRTVLSAGVWRYHPVRHEFEVFAYGGSNQWGLDFNQMGQLFMTHCRSRWGGGSTTHVVQGGHYWNQMNRGFADFVSGTAPAGYPFLRNFMLASARYGHGEGGAGKAGSRAVYGGHSHVGTMIYLGDNWPDSYRDHLFSHNLHGHQINQQINRRRGSGYDTVHAGRDVFFCEDLQHVGVDLKYGPDGAVYSTDWYDERLCHNPNVERWDRTNGRIYRIAFAETYKPVKVNLAALADHTLVELLEHKNAWFARTAQRLLHERAAAGGVSSDAREALARLVRSSADISLRLRGLWALHAVGDLNSILAIQLLRDENEFIRAWSIQLHTEDRQVIGTYLGRLVGLARHDSSPLVRLYLASVIDRVDNKTAWKIAEELSGHAEDAEDRNLPKMIWYGVAPLVSTDIDRALQLAQNSKLPTLSHLIHWYLAKQQGEGLARVVKQIGRTSGQQRLDLLEETYAALSGESHVPMPAAWSEMSAGLYESDDLRTRLLAENLAAIFADASLYPRMRRLLADRNASQNDRHHAFRILTRAFDREALPLFVQLLDEAPFRSQAITTLARFNEPSIGTALVDRFGSFSPKDQTAALNTLTSRQPWALALLDALADSRIKKETLTAFDVRQLSNLGSKTIDQRLAKQWGTVRQSSKERLEQIDKLADAYSHAPLWAYNSAAGKQLFTKHCASCHRVQNQGTDIGPKLAGSGAKGGRYFIENIVDPNAVVGNGFQTWLILTDDGRVITGLIEQSTDTAVTIQAATEKIVIPRDKIESMKKTDQSLMPEGVLKLLNDREVIELLLYLSTI